MNLDHIERLPKHKEHGWPMPTGPSEPRIDYGQDEQFDLVQDGPEHIKAPDASIAKVSHAHRDSINPNTFEHDEASKSTTSADIVAALLDVAHAFDGAAVRVRPSARFNVLRVALSPGMSVRVLGRDPSRVAFTINEVTNTTSVFLDTDPFDTTPVDGVLMSGYPVPTWPAVGGSGLRLTTAGEVYIGQSSSASSNALVAILLEYQD